MTTRQRARARSHLAINGGPKTRTAPWPERGHFGREEREAVESLIDQSIATGRVFGYDGPSERAFCQEFAEFMGGGYADAVNSGSSAVYVALCALGLEPFTEVVVSPITDLGGMMPIPLLNCIPVIADAAPGRYNVGPEQVEERITPQTSAIVIAHIGGEPVDIESIMTIARNRGIPVVEDCAQSHGATLNGQPVGSFGDIAAFSTMFSKHFNTGGQGGLVYTKSEELYKLSRRASDRGKPFFMPEGATNQMASHNLNMNDLAATIGRAQLKKLPDIVQRRREFAAGLTEGFKDMGLQAVGAPTQIHGARPSYWWWRLTVNTDRLDCDKDTFCEAVAAEGVLLTRRYEAMPHMMEWYRSRRVFGSSGYPWTCPLYKGDPDKEYTCPNAEAAIDAHFNLTIYESWADEEEADILAAFKKVEAAYLK